MTRICPCCGEEICDEFRHCPACKFDLASYDKESDASRREEMLSVAKEVYLLGKDREERMQQEVAHDGMYCRNCNKEYPSNYSRCPVCCEGLEKYKENIHRYPTERTESYDSKAAVNNASSGTTSSASIRLGGESLEALRGIKRYLGWILVCAIILVVMKGCDGTSKLLKDINASVRAPRYYHGEIRSY